MLPSLILEVGIMAAFTVGNTPWTRNDFQKPYLLVEKSFYEEFYVKAMNSSRTRAKYLDKFDPQTMLWTVEAGYNANGLRVGIGHTSEHEVAKADKLTESFNYVTISYRLEYP